MWFAGVGKVEERSCVGLKGLGFIAGDGIALFAFAIGRARLEIC